MLSDLKIKNAKPRLTDYRLVDGLGLSVLVRPNGSKLWQCRYWVSGKERKSSFGPYPLITLAEARTKRDELRRQRAQGLDPREVKREQEWAAMVAQGNSFESIARKWHSNWSIGTTERHSGQVLRRLMSDVFPALGARPITSIQTPEIVAMLKKIEQRGTLDIAKRAYQTVNQVFRYAIAFGFANDNPASKIRLGDVLPASQSTNYPRIPESELPTLMRKIRAYQGTPVTRMALELIAMTFVRTSELIGARWEELDLAAAQWRIPARRMKMRSPHIVPLARQAIEVLETLKVVTGTREFVFPGERHQNRPMSNGTMLMALKRMGYQGRMCVHGFRGLASTILYEDGFEPMHIELQLAHKQRNRVTAAYNHALYVEPRTKMMQWYADYIYSRADTVPAAA